jgi:hypothetical protein
MVESDTPSPQPVQQAIPTIRQLALRSKENLMAISFSQRPKTPMRTYVVSGALMSALGISLGFGVYLMFHPDRSEYEAHGLEGQPSVEHDQVLISGLKKVVPMHNAPAGHNPTFGQPRVIEMARPLHQHMNTHVPQHVPPPIINQAPVAPIHTYSPAVPHHPAHAPGAAGAAESFHPMPVATTVPIYEPQRPMPVHAYAGAPEHHPMAWPYQQSQAYRAGKDSRLQMVTNR